MLVAPFQPIHELPDRALLIAGEREIRDEREAVVEGRHRNRQSYYRDSGFGIRDSQSGDSRSGIRVRDSGFGIRGRGFAVGDSRSGFAVGDSASGISRQDSR